MCIVYSRDEVVVHKKATISCYLGGDLSDGTDELEFDPGLSRM